MDQRPGFIGGDNGLIGDAGSVLDKSWIDAGGWK